MVAIQKGNNVEIYDEDEKKLFSKSGELYGDNDKYVAIKKDNKVSVYYYDGGTSTGSFTL